MFNSPFELMNLDGTNGFTLSGLVTGDALGIAVSAGDLNGDGLSDLIIGANTATANELPFAGTTYVVFGRTLSNARLSLATLDGNNGFVINGVSPDDFSGTTVSSVGDVNGDGFGDLLIGAPYADTNGNGDAGESYVIFGSSTLGNGGNLDLVNLDERLGFTLTGVGAGDHAGATVSGIEDFNGDGFADLAVGAPYATTNGNLSAGQVYVVFGANDLGNRGNLDLGTLSGASGFAIAGINPNDNAGIAINAAGDVNGDGFADLIIGASAATPDGNSFAGESYVVFGGSNVGTTGELSLSSLNGSNGFVIPGINPGDFSGSAVSSAGDVNGDGFADLLIGAENADPNDITDAGETYVIFGGSNVGSTGTLNLTTLNGNNGFTITGINSGDFLGSAVSSAGDINADGFSDLIIGAFNATSNNNPSAGQSYVILGSSDLGNTGSLQLATLTGVTGFTLNGIAAGDLSGFAVSNAGDYNGDSLSDVIISAPNGNDFTGEVYLVFGTQTNVPPTLIDGTSSRETLVGTDSNDILTGRAGADTLIGGEGFDRFRYTSVRDAGDRIVDFTLGEDKIDLSQLLDSLVNGGYNSVNALTDGYIRIVGSSNTFGIELDNDGLTGTGGFRSFISVQGSGLTLSALVNPNNFIF